MQMKVGNLTMSEEDLQKGLLNAKKLSNIDLLKILKEVANALENLLNTINKSGLKR